MKSNSSKEFRKFDFSRVEWAFKLFNSSVEIHSKTGKKFSPLNSASLENFEASLDAVVQADSASAVKSVPEANNIKLLSTALMNVLSDLRWLEAASSESGKSSGEHLQYWTNLSEVTPCLNKYIFYREFYSRFLTSSKKRSRVRCVHFKLLSCFST